MKIEGCTALVTGANRGLGKAFVDALFEAGAGRVYAGARDPDSVDDARTIPVRLDVTSASDISEAVARCADVAVLVNNAGIMLSTPMMASDAEAAMRREFDVNVFGALAMIHAFAPILKNNGGGGILNVLSVVSWFTVPDNATYCASKHAALSVSDAARIQLRSQGTQVTGVYAGFINTDMAAEIDKPKIDPRQVAWMGVEGLASGQNHVRVGERAEKTWHDVRLDPVGFQQALQDAWDADHCVSPTPKR